MCKVSRITFKCSLGSLCLKEQRFKAALITISRLLKTQNKKRQKRKKETNKQTDELKMSRDLTWQISMAIDNLNMVSSLMSVFCIISWNRSSNNTRLYHWGLNVKRLVEKIQHNNKTWHIKERMLIPMRNYSDISYLKQLFGVWWCT